MVILRRRKTYIDIIGKVEPLVGGERRAPFLLAADHPDEIATVGPNSVFQLKDGGMS